MSDFNLSKKAIADLSDIWEYTYDFWSEKQADIYYEKIINSCKILSETPFIGKKYFEIQEGLYAYLVGKHIVFYQLVSDNCIEIIRILHHRMDVLNKL